MTSVVIVSFFGFIALLIADILPFIRLVWMLIPVAVIAAIVFLFILNL